ncbi:Phospholipase DDHD1 [Oryzias melastigma]|uniref:Phospholipase DDHD1 n=1 Tax=Oryzias melastigma TaxID=30732 RepID=A0A834F997_ORYME|nr:Phospholipase DDHD1 [Oryzias melastigma]
MSSVQSGLEGHLPLLHRGAQTQSELLLDLNSPEAYLDGSPLEYADPDRSNGSPLFERRKRSRSNSSRHRFNEVVTELVPEEVRWFYKEDKKTWKPFLGHDSLKIELMFRKYCELNPSAVRQSKGPESPEPNGTAVTGETASCSAHEGRGSVDTSSEERDPDGIEINVEPVCVRGGLYEVHIKEKECFPVYWKQQDHIPVMRGQWFIDGTWLPLEEEESDLIEQEHLSHFRGQQTQDTIETDLVVKTVDSKDGDHPQSEVSRTHHQAAAHGSDRGYVEEASPEDRPPQTTHIVFVVHGIGQKMDQGALLKTHWNVRVCAVQSDLLIREGNPILPSRERRLCSGVWWHTLLRFCVNALHCFLYYSNSLLVHGGNFFTTDPELNFGGLLREGVRKMEDKHFSKHKDEHVEFFPVEWRSKLTLDGDTVESITPDKVRGLRDLLNSSAMDIMYYNSPLYRDEITKGLTQELNRLYSLFCSRNPEFEDKGGKVSVVAHSLGCVITYDIITGWDPVRFCLQEHRAVEEEMDLRWMSYEEKQLLQQLKTHAAGDGLKKNLSLSWIRKSYKRGQEILKSLPQRTHVLIEP